jgi:plastocyanin
MPRHARLLITALAALLFAATAHAGQVRVNATGGQSFSPLGVTCNLGDQVIWVGTGGSHSVTSGDSALFTTTGHFSFGTGAGGLLTGKACAWKTTAVRSEPYYCIPHAPAMAGHVFVVASGAANVSDFRIVQVLFNDAGGLNRLEIANLGAAGDLGLYRLKISGVATQTLDLNGGHTISVPGNGHVVLHFNTTGTNTATDLFFPSVNLPATGSAALYVPSNFGSSTLLTATDLIIDYVQWGAGGQENEATGVGAGFWAVGAAVTNVAAGHSIQFCGGPGQYGVGQWSEIGSPTFPSNGTCSTPAIRSTWGRIKTMYH